MNISNNSIECFTYDELNSFSTCYKIIALNKIALTIIQLCLGLAIVITNLTVLALIYFKPSKRKNVFDKILIGYSITNLTTGLIDLPFFHIFSIFNYWPFSLGLCIAWNTLDNALNIINLLHSLLMFWMRNLSISNPNNYLKNFLINNLTKILFSFWLIGISVWFPLNFFYIKSNYVDGTCEIPFQPHYIEFIIYFATWILPVILIIYYSLNIIRLLNTQNKIKKQVRKQSIPKNKMSPITKITLIVILYLCQWVPSCLILMIQSLCYGCIPELVSSIFYWLTFLVAFTDPILILFLNSKYKILK